MALQMTTDLIETYVTEDQLLYMITYFGDKVNYIAL